MKAHTKQTQQEISNDFFMVMKMTTPAGPIIIEIKRGMMDRAVGQSSRGRGYH